MKNFTKLLLGAMSLVGVAGTSNVAVAQDAPEWALSGYVAVTSDYKFRGISQNDRDPSPQGSLNVTGPDGWYIGTWMSSVDFTPAGGTNPYWEMDIYGGKHFDLAGFADLNVQAYYYAYPSANLPAGAPELSYFEGIAQLSKTIDALTLTATWAYSPELAAGGGTGNYLGGNATFVVNDWLSLSGNVGHQWAQGAKYVGSRDYTHYDIGASLSYMGFVLDGRWNSTDLNAGACGAFYMATTDACKGSFVATLTYNFKLFP